MVAKSHVAVPAQQETTSRKVANKSQVQQPKLTFSPSNPIIYMQSVPVKFKLSANTNLKIVAHYSKLTYKEFKAAKDSQTVTYDFNEPSEFDLVATRGSKKLVKHITITKPTESSSSSVTNKMSSADTKTTTN
ncbi:hypothetical protein [Paucilactobacillus hokkaidonensis]|uniref:hypothetical protein n=1 Tax=Paucilactobacillus hokkaidonensis TaxID=1193095 RepID=UPI000A98B752|nr:hypothetical protein [Paucilactobacillus hokkaidonensis]